MKMIVLGLLFAASSTLEDVSARNAQEPIPIVNGEFDRGDDGRLVGWEVGRSRADPLL